MQCRDVVNLGESRDDILMAPRLRGRELDGGPGGPECRGDVERSGAGYLAGLLFNR